MKTTVSGVIFQLRQLLLRFQKSFGFKPRLWVVKCPFSSTYHYLKKSCVGLIHGTVPPQIGTVPNWITFTNKSICTGKESRSRANVPAPI